MKITPRSEEEFKSRNLLDAGEYNFEIFEAKEKKSQSGNDMIEVQLRILNKYDKYIIIYDYLMDKEPMDYKIRHLWESLGMIDKYNSGEINAEDLKDKRGKAKITIRKDKNGQYPDKNQVQDYIKSENDTFLDDALPF